MCTRGTHTHVNMFIRIGNTRILIALSFWLGSRVRIMGSRSEAEKLLVHNTRASVVSSRCPSSFPSIPERRRPQNENLVCGSRPFRARSFPSARAQSRNTHTDALYTRLVHVSIHLNTHTHTRTHAYVCLNDNACLPLLMIRTAASAVRTCLCIRRRMFNRLYTRGPVARAGQTTFSGLNVKNNRPLVRFPPRNGRKNRPRNGKNENIQRSCTRVQGGTTVDRAVTKFSGKIF